MTDQPIAAVVYGVKSSPDERESVADQYRLVVEAVEKEGGRAVVGTFGEANASGYRRERGPQLEAAMQAAIHAAAEHGEAELWVWHSSRLARGDGTKGKRSIMLIVAQLLYENVTVRSVADPTFVTPMLVGIGSEVAHKYSADLSAHTKRGIEQRRRAGKPNGGVGFGYRVDRQVIDANVISRRVPDPTTSLVVAEVLTMIKDGTTPGDVARALNARGVRTQRGNTWGREAVTNLVRNPAYVGERGYPALVSVDLWQAANDQLLRADPAAVQRRQGGRPPSADFILRGFVFCRCCGDPMYAITRGRQRLYICRNRKRGTGLCSAPPIPAELAERHILNHLGTFVGSVEDWLREKAAERTVEQEQREASIDRERGALADLDKQRARHFAEYDKLVAAGSPVAHLALERVAKFDAERERQQQRIAEAEAVVAEWGGGPDMDAALDYYSAIADVVTGQIAKADGARELGRALGSVLAGLWIEVEPDRHRLLVEFALRDPRPVTLPGGVPILPELRRERESLPPASLDYLPLTPIERAQNCQKGGGWEGSASVIPSDQPRSSRSPGAAATPRPRG